LEHLCNLPDLQSLSIDTFRAALSSSSIDDPQTFRHLCLLQIFYAPVEPTTRFLGLYRRAPLPCLSICFCAPPTEDETHMFYAAVSAGVLHSSLTDLSINSDNSTVDFKDPGEYLIQNRSLVTLLSFSNLTSLTIGLPCGFELDDSLVPDLARAWPRLDTLRLSASFPPPWPHLTLECLHSFARHNPHLRNLTINLNATVIPPSNPNAATLLFSITCKNSMRTTRQSPPPPPWRNSSLASFQPYTRFPRTENDLKTTIRTNMN
jgi:hypothetical protein